MPGGLSSTNARAIIGGVVGPVLLIAIVVVIVVIIAVIFVMKVRCLCSCCCFSINPVPDIVFMLIEETRTRKHQIDHP